jgi:hypothetical protein
MPSQLLIRIDDDLKEKIRRLSHLEKKSVSEKIRELVAEYVAEHDMESALKDLWNDIGQAIKKKGYKESDVKRLIKEARSHK